MFPDLDYARLKRSFEYFVEHHARVELITPGSPLDLLERDEPSGMSRAHRALAVAIANFAKAHRIFAVNVSRRLPGQGWLAALNSFKAHVKLLFFAGRAPQAHASFGQGTQRNRLLLGQGARREQEAGQGLAPAGEEAPGLGPYTP